MIHRCPTRCDCRAWCRSSIRSRSRSTTETRPESRSRCSRASSPIPTAGTGRFSSTCRADRDSRLRDRRASRARPAWLDRALSEFRVLMLDQRGTGRSTPVGTLPASPRRSRPTTWRTSEPTRSSATPSGSAARSASTAGPCSARASVACASRHTCRSLQRGCERRSSPEGCPARAAHRRRLRAHLRAGARAQPPVLLALSRRYRARHERASSDPGQGDTASVGRPADLATISSARPAARNERRSRAPSLPARAPA